MAMILFLQLSFR